MRNTSDNTLTFNELNYTVDGEITHYDAVLQAWDSATANAPDIDAGYWESTALNSSPKDVTQDVTGLSGNPFTIAAGATRYILITANINGDATIGDDMQVTAITIDFTVETTQNQQQVPGRVITITA